MHTSLHLFNLFSFSQSALNEKALNKLGGIQALEAKLKTNYKKGLSGDSKDIAERVKLYGKNEVRFAREICNTSMICANMKFIYLLCSHYRSFRSQSLRRGYRCL